MSELVNSSENENTTEIDIVGLSDDNKNGILSEGIRDRTQFVDVVGNSTENRAGNNESTLRLHGSANAGPNQNQIPYASDVKHDRSLIQLDDDSTTNLNLSVSSEAHSPIPLSNKQFEKSFLNINGSERLRGDGTPPGSSVGQSAYTYDQQNKSHFVQNRSAAAFDNSANESQPLLVADAETSNYSSFDAWTDGIDPSRPKSNEIDSYLRDRLNSKKTWKTSSKIWLLIVISLLANIALFTAKIYVVIESHSLAVLASAVDSLLDLISQVIVYLALRGSQEADEQTWPVGRSRLEPVGIIVCASLMGMASLQIVYQSSVSLVQGILDEGDRNIPLLGGITTHLLVSAIAIKGVLFICCYSLKERSHSVMVLAEDHRNDVFSNSVALVTAYLSHKLPLCWWLDASGAILISVYICITWTIVAKEQAEFLVGRAAQPEFLEEVRRMANEHHDNMFVDIVRGYHFGKRYLVELEVVLPEQMYVSEAHDIALELQKEVEKLHQVERAFVHVDYTTRDENEHKDARLELNTPASLPEKAESVGAFDDYRIDENIKVTGAIYAQTHPQSAEY
eukprot:CAMPEP_0184007018 /NCGR_PEP_ID=MMETSP0954-20121128/1067_1 /TAXON_ID=627963 /ORGANISM="Aplanochytrium sp, Strain PBS07" /LENGTH=565 /DNA_ID=CAMNT_0026285735 /DNA_START=469 /DNA_END=2166 /DNA_ORIENTATION=-